jgi:hypothetical protein
MIIYLLLLILLIILFFILNYKVSLENFDIYGAKPWDLGWGLGTPLTESEDEKDCNPGFLCNTENNFGLYNNKCECIPINKDNTSESENCNPGFLCIDKNGIGLYNNSCECKITNNKSNSPPETSKLPKLDQDCYPKNTNFDALCKKAHPKNGIKQIIPCSNNTAKVECGLNYINGVFYDDKILRTPCHNIMTDFDTWCKYYNSSSVPPGYNVNSIGSKEILIGSKGGCYYSDGESDNSKASAICDYNHMDEIKKLPPANNSIDYNIFTDCRPIRGSNFIRDCANLLKVDYKDAYADQIMGYDCNPGFARAKCIKSKDMKVFNHNLFNGSYDKKNPPIETVAGANCSCKLV